MKMILENGDPASNRIRHYEPGRITVNDKIVETSVLIAPGRDIAQWAPDRFENLDPIHAKPILALEPEVVLLGTGAAHQFPSREFLRLFLARGIGIEVMTTESACRTYNILIAEDRHVVAALIVE